MFLGQNFITKIRNRISSLSQELSSHSLDHLKRRDLQRELSFLSNLYSKISDISKLESEKKDLEAMLSGSEDKEMLSLIALELDAINNKIVESEKEFELSIVPPDELQDRSVFLEIRAGTGGQEASLFAADLMKMYLNYSLKKGWVASIADSSATDLGGFREIVLHIEGKDVFKHLKHESGVHRVQRVPQTETSGRVHTSTATVAVLPEAEEVEVSINPSDLKIDTYRAGGAGGQHVNKTDSAVRITHLPTGVVVTCQDERSQHKNKAKAMKILQSRLFAAHQSEQHSKISQQRKELVGSGERSEKVRTYNFPQNRLTDHQVDMTLKKLDMVIEGDLDEIIQALIQKDDLVKKQNFIKSLNI